MAKEVYRSFEGKLGTKKRDGYIITELEDFYEIEFLSVYKGEGNGKVRIRKEMLSIDDFSNLSKIGKLQIDIEFGLADVGQCLYNGKWYGYDSICEIRDRNHTNDWKRYV